MHTTDPKRKWNSQTYKTDSKCTNGTVKRTKQISSAQIALTNAQNNSPSEQKGIFQKFMTDVLLQQKNPY